MAKRTRVVTGGVDTHGRTHHAAVIDQQGRLLADAEFGAHAEPSWPARSWRPALPPLNKNLHLHGLVEASKHYRASRPPGWRTFSHRVSAHRLSGREVVQACCRASTPCCCSSSTSQGRSRSGSAAAWQACANGSTAGFVTFLAHPFLSRIGRPIDVLDAAGLAVFCVTGASTALDHGLAAAPAVILGAITGIGGGILRDILVRQTPVVLREGLYAIPALIGAAIVIGAAHAGVHGPAAPIIGATICFVIRLAGLTLGLNIPRARHINRE